MAHRLARLDDRPVDIGGHETRIESVAPLADRRAAAGPNRPFADEERDGEPTGFLARAVRTGLSMAMIAASAGPDG